MLSVGIRETTRTELYRNLCRNVSQIIHITHVGEIAEVVVSEKKEK